MSYKPFSRKISVFHGRQAPEEGLIVGYGALIDALYLPMPLPSQLALISLKNRKYTTEQWIVLTPRHKPEDSLYRQLVFAMKYEGINLLFFKKLFETLSETQLTEILQIEPLGQYSRKIWFLYEWLQQKALPFPDLKMGNFVNLVDDKLQYTLQSGERSSRHRIINNLPGTVNFCPLIRKTAKLETYLADNLSAKKDALLQGIRKSILQRTSAFLLLKDSKASFTIEGESPKSKRAARWGQAIGQAGVKDLSHSEFERLQQIVIEDTRFVKMGYRTEGGFIGERDPETFSPIPDHISAKPEDIIRLMDGLIETNRMLQTDEIDAVLAAAAIAFGFVFIHPFVDGNGRIHRYLVHHVLAKKQFSDQGIIFPVSASILDHIADYQETLESYSRALLDFIDWEESANKNVKVTNHTLDYYRYFDATKQAEFLYGSVKDTIENIIPAEVDYLSKYEEFKSFLDNTFEMPDDLVALLIRFLGQNDGRLSKRAKTREFEALSEKEVEEIESQYLLVFHDSKKK